MGAEMTFTFADPTEWWLDISPTVWRESWHASQHQTTVGSRWSAHLNRLCLSVVSAWLRAEYTSQATVWPRAALAAMWDVVNGTAIAIGSKRLVLIPTEAMDDGELDVPQEWVDIPSWAADYYLAVQVQSNCQSDELSEEQADGQWLRVWGYTTHQALKTQGRYDPDDRTYCLDGQVLIKDMNTLWVTMQYCPNEQTKAAIAPLAALDPAQAENLLQRLSQDAIAVPRLAVPFTLWGALLEQDHWRERLYHQRLGQRLEQSQASNLFISLSQWLQGQITAGWQSLNSLGEAEAISLAVRLRSTLATDEASVTQTKRIELNTQTGRSVVLLLVALTAEPDGRISVLVQLHPDQEQPWVPPNLTLSLLSDLGEILQSVQAGEQDDYIQLRLFRCSPDTRFSLQVAFEEYVVIEAFVV
jgi:hypothetical protein